MSNTANHISSTTELLLAFSITGATAVPVFEVESHIFKPVKTPWRAAYACIGVLS